MAATDQQILDALARVCERQCDATDTIAAHCDSYSRWCSNTIRTARSRTSAGYRPCLAIEHPILSRRRASKKSGPVHSRFPIDILKIDKSFIDDIDNDVRRAQMVRTIIGLGVGLSLTVVAEGIETSGQRDALLTMAPALGQGYLFSRPVDVATIDALLRSQAPDAAPRSTESLRLAAATRDRT